MDPLPAEIAKLATEAKFPPIKNGIVELNALQVAAISALLKALVGYIQIEYARCGQTTPPATPATN